MHSSLFKKFFERMDKALENGKISLSLLYGLNYNEYETSLTAEIYFFLWLLFRLCYHKNNIKIR
jgi:hypothetical protein